MYHWHRIVFLAMLIRHACSRCPQGTVVLSEDKSELYFSENTRVAPCPRGLSCSFYNWKNFDFRTKGKSYIEYGTCDDTFNPRGCDFLKESHFDGEVEDCTYTECEPGDSCSLSFTTTICNLGIIFYDSFDGIVLDSMSAGQRSCPPDNKCGFFRFRTTKDGYEALAEMGVCIPPDGLDLNCTTLTDRPNIDDVSACTLSECDDARDLCYAFGIPPTPGRGFRCDQGLFTYNLERDLLCADDVSSKPCSPGDACGQLSWINTDKNGNQTYIEYGFCIDVDERYDLNCQNVTDFDFVENATNCGSALCSRDFCHDFTFLQSVPECPPRPPWNDVQLLPGCSTLQALRRGTTCATDFLKKWPYTNVTESMCTSDFNEAFTCLRDVAADCIVYQNDGVTPCPSALDGVTNITYIFTELLEVTSEVNNTGDLIRVLDEKYNITNDQLDILEKICDAVSDQDELISFINSLKREIYESPIWLGEPICSDSKVVDDLARWSLDFLMKVVTAKYPEDVCKAFFEFKDQILDLVKERCYGLRYITQFLKEFVGKYYAILFEKALQAVWEAFKDFYPPCCPPPIIKCSETPKISLGITELRKLKVISGDYVIISPKRIDYGYVYPKCMKKVELAGVPLKFDIDLTDCHPEIKEDDYFINFTFTVRNKPYKDIKSPVQRFYDNCLTLTCSFDRKENVKTGKLLPYIRKTEIGEIEKEVEFDLKLKFYENDEYNVTLVDNRLKVQVPDDVYAKVDLVRLNDEEDDFKVQLKYCYASLNCEDDSPRYDLIVESCPANPYVEVKRNYAPKYGTFKFKSFVWTNVSDDEQKIYVRCKVVICHDSDHYPCPPKPDCGRKRRDVIGIEDHETSSLVTSEALKILLSKRRHLCDVNNGGCSDKCQMIGDDVVCNCYGRRQLAANKKTCYYPRERSHHFYKTNSGLMEVTGGQPVIMFGLVIVAVVLTGYIILSIFQKKRAVGSL